jgi:hypothetical protein
VTPAEAARLLGVAPTAPWDDVRRAYRAQIRTHHPDRSGGRSSDRATAIIEAYRVLSTERSAAGARPGPADGSRTGAPTARRVPPRPHLDTAAGAPPVVRTEPDALLVRAPADEAFRWLVEAAHDVGEITYVDRSMPILEVLCRFEGEPATSLLLTLQGRAEGTEVLCTVESIEARPAPPTAAVVDLLELALHRRRGDQSSRSS